MHGGGRDQFDWLHELGYAWADWVFDKFTYLELVDAVFAGEGLLPW